MNLSYFVFEKEWRMWLSIFINIGSQKPNGDFKDSWSVDLMMPMRK